MTHHCLARLYFFIFVSFMVDQACGFDRLTRETTGFLSFPSSTIAVIEREIPAKGMSSIIIQFDDYVDSENLDKELDILSNISYMLDLSCRANITHGHLRKVAQIPLVRALALAETYLDNAGLNIISAMPLQYLNISGNRFDDDGMPTVGLISQLIELKIGSNKVTRKGISSLAGLKNLKILDAKCTYLEDDGIQELSIVGNQLEVLNVRACGFGDAALNYFLTMPSLKVLHISGNRNLTPAGVEKFLAQKRSNLVVKYDQ